MKTFFCIDELSISQIAIDLTTSEYDQTTALIINEENKLEVYVSMKMKFVHKLFEQDIKDVVKRIHKIFAFGGIIYIEQGAYYFTGIYKSESKKCTFLVDID
ncbi:MAG: hypothetical protein HXX09_09860 [Bacteroidetes bacterium]|nr:hypothetical protein [Bacteroidota bacterium]